MCSTALTGQMSTPALDPEWQRGTFAIIWWHLPSVSEQDLPFLPLKCLSLFLSTPNGKELTTVLGSL